jgi:hypothetical protein
MQLQTFSGENNKGRAGITINSPDHQNLAGGVYFEGWSTPVAHWHPCGSRSRQPSDTTPNGKSIVGYKCTYIWEIKRNYAGLMKISFS